ncbi:hypothetical protein AB0M28_21320 [Streptomyces sp. NPDC051940]|uniref:hypothetical protein n=1 Tax=Streptomyces sp. NPDC051940 TaxID=3155675 RepID=UPI00342DBE45
MDIAAAVPELAGLGRTAVRLHPRPGTPGVDDSSVGGPLLWPRGEAWPRCDASHETFSVHAVADVRLRRRILTEAWGRPQQPGTNLLTPDETAVLDRISGNGYGAPDGPVPMLPVLQLYARDAPDAGFPPGSDLLQLLWCPFGHGDDYLPAIRIRWRTVTEIGVPSDDRPEPAYAEDDFVPAPCVLHPEPVVEYPPGHLLPEEVVARLDTWARAAGHRPFLYSQALSVAPGWKAGGWPAPWTFRDPEPVVCGCGAPMDALLTADSGEWQGEEGLSWRPVEEPVSGSSYPPAGEPTLVTMGRGYTMQIYRCPRSAEHPPQATMQ